ncbi:transglutaminase [Hylemonella gracilis str. Niagara R]|uniref:Transglutaminase n=1 Tax=Hylemonella gracilis str. Niagara R TaxID=1458275 RepID=A0A016XGV1_9BURK|nr:transglutaminase family protein [Hylemonella gracilis]EYC51115.1 transglutaminase [Hylemonella gracilis str. Niagara R]
MDLHITHETRYDYASTVELAQHMAYLRPPDTPWQTVRAHQLEIETGMGEETPPTAPAGPDACSLDVYGNHRAYFALDRPHTLLRVTARSALQTRAPRAAARTTSEITWEDLRGQYRYQAQAAWHAAAEFSFASPRAPRHDAFAAYARPSFAPGRPALQAARELMARIHADFRYETQSTEVHTPALEALELRSGVCQDFAHIMLACLRSVGLAARYVSGYLLTTPPPGQPRLIGSDASHAWVSLWLPDLRLSDEGPGAKANQETATDGWYDLDPTNARDGWGTPGEDYVTLATGRDYADVPPLRGVIHGGGAHGLHVAVTVAPEGEALQPGR